MQCRYLVRKYERPIGSRTLSLNKSGTKPTRRTALPEIHCANQPSASVSLKSEFRQRKRRAPSRRLAESRNERRSQLFRSLEAPARGRSFVVPAGVAHEPDLSSRSFNLGLDRQTERPVARCKAGNNKTLPIHRNLKLYNMESSCGNALDRGRRTGIRRVDIWQLLLGMQSTRQSDQQRLRHIINKIVSANKATRRRNGPLEFVDRNEGRKTEQGTAAARHGGGLFNNEVLQRLLDGA